LHNQRNHGVRPAFLWNRTRDLWGTVREALPDPEDRHSAIVRVQTQAGLMTFPAAELKAIEIIFTCEFCRERKRDSHCQANIRRIQSGSANLSALLQARRSSPFTRMRRCR